MPVLTLAKQLPGNKQQRGEKDEVGEQEHAHTQSFCRPKIKC